MNVYEIYAWLKHFTKWFTLNPYCHSWAGGWGCPTLCPILQIRTQRLRQITKLIQVYKKLARVEASVQTQKCLSPKPESGPQTLTPRLHWEMRGSPAHSWLTDHICRTDLQWKPFEGMSYPRETLSQWPGETERLRQLPCILSKDNKTGIWTQSFPSPAVYKDDKV